MSAPIVGCGIADAIGALLPMLNDSLGCKASVEHFPRNWVTGQDPMFVIYLFDNERAFQGMGDTLSRALLNANTERQTFQEKLEKAA